MSTELKPCPFCGGPAAIVQDWPSTYGEKCLYGIGCADDDCIAYTGYGTELYDTYEEAAAAWNRRDAITGNPAIAMWNRIANAKAVFDPPEDNQSKPATRKVHDVADGVGYCQCSLCEGHIDTYENGELFVYVNGDRWELGMVKRPNNTGDGYFCWYSRGDTAANTPTRCTHKLSNAGWTHIEQACENRDGLLQDLVQLVAIPAFDCCGCKYEEHHDCKDGCMLIRRAKELGIEVEESWDS